MFVANHKDGSLCAVSHTPAAMSKRLEKHGYRFFEHDEMNNCGVWRRTSNIPGIMYVVFVYEVQPEDWAD